MKPDVPASVFLERRSYRRRRMMDALRLLPVAGLLLLMLPIFWPSEPSTEGAAVSMSTAVIYVFVVWLALIFAALGLWRFLWSGQTHETDHLVPDRDEGTS